MSRRAPATAGMVLAMSALAACGSAQGRNDTTVTATAAPRQGASVAATSAPTPAAHPCGAAAPETLARAYGAVAQRIYAKELSSSEVASDKRQVEGFAPLLQALEHGNRSAVREAVTSLVYSHTHVVRLRVTRGANVLADVGGPYIIAPVSGTLRRGGHTLGHFVFSVQDDLGYVKLVNRFIGVPMVLRAGSRTLPVEGNVTGAPAAIPAHGPVTYRGRTYQAFSFDAEAYPSGALRVSLLVTVTGSLANRDCSELVAQALGNVARRVSRRFALSPATFQSFIGTAGPLTGGLLYVRSGSRQLAGSTSPGPARLPASGTVTYRGAVYRVFSFTAPTSVGQVRVYQLVRP